MTFYQENNMLFALHGITWVIYLFIFYTYFKQGNIIKSPNQGILISTKHVSIFFVILAMFVYETYYLSYFVDSKRDIYYMYVTSLQQNILAIITMLYIKKR